MNNMTKYYAGIGSRKTPDDICRLMYLASYYLAYDGFCLRSGGAEGADQAFQRGVEKYNNDFNFKELDNMDIFLPEPGFKGSQFPFKELTKDGYHYFHQYHPYSNTIRSNYVKKLMCRNTYQVLGYDCKTPSKFVLCWTPNGCITHEERIEAVKKTGGTGQAISIADCHNINIYNLQRPEHRIRIENYIEKKKKLLAKISNTSISKPSF